MAGDAHQTNVRIVCDRQWIATLEHGQSRGAGMATSAAVNAARRAHVLDDGVVAAGFPFVKGRMMVPSMAATANLRRNVNPRSHGDVVRIRGVISRRPMATFALHARQPRKCVLVLDAHKAIRQTITNRVAGDARTVRLSS